MRLRSPAVAVAAVALTLAAGAACASTCYLVYDAGDNIAYRGPNTPVDLSARGAAARAALRQRGEYLLIIEADRCEPTGAALGSPESAPKPVDAYVAGMKSVMRSGDEAPATANRGSPRAVPATGGGAPAGPATTAAPQRSAPPRAY